MAKLNFAQRYRTDQAFRAVVEEIHLEAVLESANIDPESLNEVWESGIRPLTLSTFRDVTKTSASTGASSEVQKPEVAAPAKKRAPRKKASS